MIPLLILLSLFAAPAYPATSQAQAYTTMYDPSVCPPEPELGHNMIRGFLIGETWSDNRIATGTTGLSPDQIRPLTDATDLTACQYFNNRYASYARKDDYDFGYYKVGPFYFVTQTLKLPDSTPDANGMVRVVSGLSFLLIYDAQMNYIKGYGY